MSAPIRIPTSYPYTQNDIITGNESSSPIPELPPTQERVDEVPQPKELPKNVTEEFNDIGDSDRADITKMAVS